MRVLADCGWLGPAFLADAPVRSVVAHDRAGAAVPEFCHGLRQRRRYGVTVSVASRATATRAGRSTSSPMA